MREIKFRAWDKRVKKMYCVHEIEWDAIQKLFTLDVFADGNYTFISDNFELMQYTGLKDKNNKSIYDGDILKYIRFNWYCPGNPQHNTDLVSICEVYWSDENYAFRERGNYKDGGGWSGGLKFEDQRADKNEIEIIGNIWEHKHLLDNS